MVKGEFLNFYFIIPSRGLGFYKARMTEFREIMSSPEEWTCASYRFFSTSKSPLL